MRIQNQGVFKTFRRIFIFYLNFIPDMCVCVYVYAYIHNYKYDLRECIIALEENVVSPEIYF